METQIIHKEYSDVMKKSYIDYAMSVIVARALPDIRDGLKPVQRRILYDMKELGTYYDKPHRKSARIVGDTMGKYHPHGDSAIYDALVGMAQGFKKELPLVDGHGNFGSIEGDGAAAMRYTEARLTKIAQEIYLGDMDKNIVDYISNFDETEKEPEVLPVRVPNILVNGAEGIAVGMATSIPPHNLTEVVDAVIATIKNPNISIEQIMKYIKGPDFPTAGIVINKDELLDIYNTGTGKIKLRGKVDIETLKNGKKQIVISEIPYTMLGANIGKFLQDVADLTKDKKLEDAKYISDIANMSSKEGMRIEIELKKEADAERIINMLYKKTKLEDTFGVNMIAVVNGKPEIVNLKSIINHHINFQTELCTRKYKTLLKKAVEQKEIQEGLIKAYDCIDLIIEILRGSQKREQVKNCLTQGKVKDITFRTLESKKLAQNLNFTEKQADTIMDMRLVKLIGLEIAALKKEYQKTLGNIQVFEDILNNKESMEKVIIKDLQKIKKEYGVKRKTQITNSEAAVFEESPIKEMEVTVLIDRLGYCKVIDNSIYEKNKRAADDENIYVFQCMNTDKICIFTEKGRMHSIKVLDLPYGKFRDKGVPIDNLSDYDSNEDNIVDINLFSVIISNNIVFVTSNGMIKVVSGESFNVNRKTIGCTKLAAGDILIAAMAVCNNKYIVLQTVNGMFLKFSIDAIPEKKKLSIGSKGVKLINKDKISNVYFIDDGEYTISYYEKKLDLKKLKCGNWNEKGIKVRKK